MWQTFVEVGSLIDVIQRLGLKFLGVWILPHVWLNEELCLDLSREQIAQNVRLGEIHHGDFDIHFVHASLTASGFDSVLDSVIDLGAIDDAGEWGLVFAAPCSVPVVLDDDILEHDPGGGFDLVPGLLQRHAVDRKLTAMFEKVFLGIITG